MIPTMNRACWSDFRLKSIKLSFRLSLTLNHTPLTGFIEGKFMFFNYAVASHSSRTPLETSVETGNCSFVTAFRSKCVEECNRI